MMSFHQLHRTSANTWDWLWLLTENSIYSSPEKNIIYIYIYIHIQVESLAKGPKLLSIKNYVIEIMI